MLEGTGDKDEDGRFSGDRDLSFALALVSAVLVSVRVPLVSASDACEGRGVRENEGILARGGLAGFDDAFAIVLANGRKKSVMSRPLYSTIAQFRHSTKLTVCAYPRSCLEPADSRFGTRLPRLQERRHVMKFFPREKLPNGSCRFHLQKATLSLVNHNIQKRAVASFLVISYTDRSETQFACDDRIC